MQQNTRSKYYTTKVVGKQPDSGKNNRMKNAVCRIGRPRFYLEKSACDGGISLFFFITFIGDNTLLIGAEVLVVTVL